MASVREMKFKLIRLVNELVSEREQEGLITGADALALVKNRMIQKGDFVDGKKRSYSSRYSSQRQKKGRQTRYVDLSFSGRMWANTGVRTIRRKAFGTVVRIEGRNLESKKKLEANSSRYKVNVLGLTKDEILILKRNRKKRIIKKLRRL